MGDFNGDGVADLAATTGSVVNVLLGNGNGSFQAPASYNGGPNPRCVAAADFNGDGISDLVVSNQNYTFVSILIGNGDGTFKTGVNYTVGTYPQALAIGDFNRDGIADIAVVNAYNAGLSILIGKGDGTFRTAVNYSGISATQYVAVGDFNNDGNPDIVTSGSSGLNLFFGNGDGTFQNPATISSALASAAVVVADFNGDGKADLAVGTYSSGSLAMFMGKGDGTFQPPVSYPVANYITGVVAGDFNGDGRTDLAVTSNYYPGADLFVMYGNGDGTFQSAIGYSSNQNLAVAGGEFNGDGIADLVLTSTAGASIVLGGAIPDLAITISDGNGFTQGQVGALYTINVTNLGDIATSGAVGVVASLPFGFTASAISGNGWTCVLNTLACTRSDTLARSSSYPSIVLTVNVPAALTGTVTASATVSGGGDQNTANNTATDTSFVRFLPSVSLSASPNSASLGHAVTLNASMASGPTGRVTFFDGASALGAAPLSSGQATLVTYALQGGTHSLRALYDGDLYYGPAASNVVSEIVTQIPGNGVQAPITCTVPGLGQMIAAADFNRDGHTDLAAVSGNTISVLLGNGNGTFVGPYTYAVTSYTTLGSLVVDDFNGDGNPDVAVSDSSSLYVLLGNGDGTFQTVMKTTVGSSPYLSGLVSADFDGDGRIDLAVLNSAVPIVFLGNGNGTFQPPVTLPNSGNTWTALRVADMNGDGKADLVCMNNGYNGYVSVLLGNGNGTFQAPINFADSSLIYPDTFVVGDFNGDGKQDVAVIYWVGVTVLAGNGDGTLTVSKKTSLFGVPGYQAIAGDFNGDGKLDIAYAAYASGGFYLAFGNGDGSFQSGAELLSTGSPAGFIAADFNGDGRMDIAATNPTYSNGTVNVFLGSQYSGLSISLTHNGNFTGGASGMYQIQVSNPTFLGTSGTVTVTITLPFGLTASALSGNNWTCTLGTLTCTRTDSQQAVGSSSPIVLTVSVSVAIAPSTVAPKATVSNGGLQNSSTDATTIVTPTTTSLGASPNPSTFGQAVTLTASVSAASTGTVEFFDGGNFLGSAVVSGTQAVLTTRLLPAGVRAVKATYGGDATHGASSSPIVSQTVAAGAASGLSAGASFATGAGPVAVASGDFNQDGKTDLVTVNSSAGSISVLLGNGDGTFRAKVDYAVGTNPLAVGVGDFNSDGKPDLAVANQSGNSVSVLLGNGDGTFQAAINLPANLPPGSIAIGDLNGDGHADIVIGSSSGTLTLFGNGDGTFYTGPAGVYYGSNVALGYFNSDAITDLAAGSGAIYVSIGNGDGTFGQSNYWPSGGNGMFALGDLNGDGKLDIVTPTYNGVAVYLGRGDGTYASSNSATMNMSPVWVAVSDVNGDGKPDVITANGSGNSISVLLGNGDGTLQSAISYNVGTQAAGVVAGDFNGDGRTDIATVNNQSNSISILSGILTPVLSVAISHNGSFAPGQAGAVYQIAVTNNGPGATSGTVTVTDSLPAGLTATGLSGPSWNCTLATLTCTRTDPLVASASYPAITLTVGVSPTAPSSVTNTAMVSGGGAIGATTTDFTVITSTPPVFAISKTHVGSLTAGEAGAVYTVTVSNGAGAGPSVGQVTVTENVPAGLTLVGMAGAGWTCSGNVCGRSDALAANSSYPPISVYVSVASNAPSTIVNSVAVSGGGSLNTSASDPTSITPPGPPVNVAVTPNAGTGSSQEFTATYWDAQGYQDITQAFFMVASNATGVNGCFVMVQGNFFYLGSDAGTSWLGPVQGGASGTVQNSQCTLAGSSSSISGSGNSFTVRFGLTFASGFGGSKNLYQMVFGKSGNTSWQQDGTWTPYPAAPPTNVSVSPASGSGSSQVFTVTYSDVLGYQDIGNALFMVASNSTGVSGCFVMWVPGGNLFYLGNDAANAWLGPIQGGTSATLQNSQCTLSAAGSYASGTGSTLAVHFALTFAGSFSGARNTYQLSIGSGGNTGWQQAGTWTAGAPQLPTNVSVSPSSGSGSSQVFTASYSDVQGYQDISRALFMVAPNGTGVTGCFAMWVSAGNLLYLGNDAANAWLGPIQVGGSSTLQNSQCTLSASTSFASGTGTALTVHFGLTFASGFIGTKNSYEMVFGSAGNTSWQQVGTWAPGTLQLPSNVSVSPASGIGTSQTFTATYSDPQGFQDISNALFMVAADSSGVGGCFVMWAKGNYLYLGNDAANAWLGPIQGGTSATLQNSQCTLNGAASVGNGTGNILTAQFGLSFAGTYTGSKYSYELAIGSGGNTGWQQKGTWTPTASGPPANVSVTPSSGSGPSQIFTATYSDTAGYQDISRALFMVAGNTSGVGGCFVMWTPGNYLYLGNDAANAWLGPIQGGTTATVQNSQCTLSGATSSGGGSGNTLTVSFGLTFSGSFTTAQNTYQLVFGSGGNTGWQLRGTWTP